jgi:hypothetical protein
MTQATVVATSLNLRTQPNGMVLRSLEQGTVVRIVEDLGDWVEVVAEGNRGFVMEKYLRHAAPPIAPPAAPDPIPPEARPSDLRVDGKRCLGPAGVVFGTTFKQGIFNTGRIRIAAFMATKAQPMRGVTPSLRNVMIAVAENEGALEAINTWDACFLSFGSLQWTAGQGTDPGELGGLLGRMKANYPDAFFKYFHQYGIDVARPTGQPVIQYSHLRLNGELLDTPGRKAVLRQAIWAYRFWRAGHDETVQRCEAEHIVWRLATFYPQSRAALGGRRIADLITSEYGVALVFDQHTNRPGHVEKTVAEAYRRCVDEGRTPADPARWNDVQAALLLERYVALRHDTSMTDSLGRANRLRAAMTAGRLSAARGSFEAA